MELTIKKEFASALRLIHTHPLMMRGQSRISDLMKATVRWLETKLVDRLHNKVKLSDAGEDLLDRAQGILRRAESIGRKSAATGSKNDPESRH